uniref:Uncharacterized protein n=1 Tax=Leptocylindrus danicus TaxID=163516 RepID=A0A7S2L506_9STRA|mmetsp:Transcript_3107/g.4521  ORF Transcript_3107/g.4521 Transcript_3107/m.4521 type:complete len:358 (+) Transcript_3107:140-1213(+)
MFGNNASSSGMIIATVIIALVIMRIIGSLFTRDGWKQNKGRHENLNFLSTKELEERLRQIISGTSNDDEQCISLLRALIRQTAEKVKVSKEVKIVKELDIDKVRENLSCQDISYAVLGKFPHNDIICTEAFSLLILVAGTNEVKERTINESETYGIDVPLRIMRESLHRIKQVNGDDGLIEERERIVAELQRKGALLLGAYGDGDKDMATIVVDEDGIDCLLEAASFFRKHQGVCKWVLWALFILCYDHIENQQHFVRLDGIQKVCCLLGTTENSIDSQRHGIALLFDSLRENPLGPNKITARMIAVSAGIHGIVGKSMSLYAKESPEILLMGKQILVGTGYRGEIPQFAIDSVVCR